MIDVVAAHGLDNGPEAHGAALRVNHGFRMGLKRERAYEREVPVAHRVEGGERVPSTIPVVMSRPFLLVEGLNGVMVFTESLPQTEAEDQLAVGEVADDLTGTPLPWSRRLIGALSAEFLKNGLDFSSSCRKHFQRVLTA